MVGSPVPEMVRVVCPSEEPYGGYTDVMIGVRAIEYVNVWFVACVDAMLKSVSLGPNDTCESGCSFSMTTAQSLMGDSFFPKNWSSACGGHVREGIHTISNRYDHILNGK